MLRECNLEEMTDGKRYGLSDMVKADCNDCKGCSDCCRGMGSSIVLDPLDCFRLSKHLQKGFGELLAECLELNVVDGVILPNLKMAGDREACVFLNEEGRCSIHSARPGICRIFPLGRIYENREFEYILQVHECPMPNKSKVKVSKWIDTPELKKNQQFIKDWHYFLKDIHESLKNGADEATIKNTSMLLLNTFFVQPYDMESDFYEQFYQRLESFPKL